MVFRKSLQPCALDESSLSIRRVNRILFPILDASRQSGGPMLLPAKAQLIALCVCVSFYEDSHSCDTFSAFLPAPLALCSMVYKLNYGRDSIPVAK